MRTHSVTVGKEYFKAMEEGKKTFDIRENSESYRAQDIIVYIEYDETTKQLTGNRLVRQITYVTEFAQKENNIVLALKEAPSSFLFYIEMTEKERAIFKSIVVHKSLYGFTGRDNANTFWDILHILTTIETCQEVEFDLTDRDIAWFMNYWNEYEDGLD